MDISQLFQQYKELLQEHCALDELNLKESQLKLPAHKHFWAGKCIMHKRDLTKLKRQREMIKKELVEKIAAEPDVEISKMAIANKVNQLPEIQEIDREIEDMETLILYVEKAEQIFKSMSFDIGNLINIQKLEQL